MIPCSKCSGKATPGTAYFDGTSYCEDCYHDMIIHAVAVLGRAETHKVRSRLWAKWDWVGPKRPGVVRVA